MYYRIFIFQHQQGKVNYEQQIENSEGLAQCGEDDSG